MHEKKLCLFKNEFVWKYLQLYKEWLSVSSIIRASNNSNGLFLNELDLIEVLLGYAAQNNGTIVEKNLCGSRVSHVSWSKKILRIF